MKADASHGCPLVASGFSFSPRMTVGGPRVEGPHTCPHPRVLCSTGARTGLSLGPAYLPFSLPTQGVPSTPSPDTDAAPSELKDSLSQSFFSTTPLPSVRVGWEWGCAGHAQVRAPNLAQPVPLLWITGRGAVFPGMEFPTPSNVGIRD